MTDSGSGEGSFSFFFFLDFFGFSIIEGSFTSSGSERTERFVGKKLNIVVLLDVIFCGVCKRSTGCFSTTLSIIRSTGGR